MTMPLFDREAWAPLAAAWMAYWSGDREARLIVYADDGGAEEMPVAVFFRGEDELRPADREALALVRGRVLDGGAGVGALALILGERGFRVTALEVIPEGVEIMKGRALAEVWAGRLEDLLEEPPHVHAYDSILLLMNGTALAGTLRGFPRFLAVLEGLLAPGGQVLIDSTDLLQRGSWDPTDGDDTYPGGLQYQIEFDGTKGAPFPQLFLDPGTLTRVARPEGWEVETVWEGEGGEYLARLTRTAAD
jgi:SAM-dependent methyltransferase